MAATKIVHRWQHGVSWRAADEGMQQRTAHALEVDGRVWLVDPVDTEGIDEEVTQLGEVAGVVVLLNRHTRHAAALARRHGVTLWLPDHTVSVDDGVVTMAYGVELPDAPFIFIAVQQVERLWVERALWWPQEQVLVAADVVGAAEYYLSSPAERLALHPLLRVMPPQQLSQLSPRLVLCGHGDPVIDDATAALREAFDTARSDLPMFAVASARRAWETVSERIKRGLDQ